MRRGAPAGQRALFDRGSVRTTPSTGARLRALALTAPQRAPRAQSRTQEDSDTLEKLRGYAVQLATHFGLKYTSIEAEVDGVIAHYGICYADGTIRIRLRHATTGRLLKESSLVDTLCHELAHLKHFDHSLRFRRFHERVLAEARRLGWYRPGRDARVTKPRLLWEVKR